MNGIQKIRIESQDSNVSSNTKTSRKVDFLFNSVVNFPFQVNDHPNRVKSTHYFAKQKYVVRGMSLQ